MTDWCHPVYSFDRSISSHQNNLQKQWHQKTVLMSRSSMLLAFVLATRTYTIQKHMGLMQFRGCGGTADMSTTAYGVIRHYFNIWTKVSKIRVRIAKHGVIVSVSDPCTVRSLNVAAEHQLMGGLSATLH